MGKKHERKVFRIVFKEKFKKKTKFSFFPFFFYEKAINLKSINGKEHDKKLNNKKELNYECWEINGNYILQCFLSCFIGTVMGTGPFNLLGFSLFSEHPS
jgi:hypothetical protein